MPKSSKKKTEKAADFSKAKLKLGKGKQAPSNVVDTSFKARSIALPSQSIATDKDAGAPSTRRRLTFEALIVHLKHYNAATRKDAILGLRELLEAHPELISTHLTTLVNSCVRVIGDEDSSVRKTLLSFFSWLFLHVPQDDLMPHSPVLLLFTTSAQTHIFPEIRIDAVRFLDVFLEHIPDVVTEGWTQQGGGGHGRRVLEGYLGILNAGTTFGEGGDTGPVQATSTASVVLSPASKLVVLRSLAAFLKHAVGAGRDIEVYPTSATLTTPTWYFSSSFASSSAFDAFDALLRPKLIPSPRGGARHPVSSDTRSWMPEASEECEEDFAGLFSLVSASNLGPWAIQDMDNVDAAVAASSGEAQTGITPDQQVASGANVARALHPTLVSTFLDCAPAVFSPSSTPPETELQMVLVVCRICRSLYGRILQDAAESGRVHETAESDLQAMLSYLSPYFPFTVNGPVNARRDVKVEQAFQDLNLIFCELSSLLVLASQGGDHASSARRPKSHPARSSRSAPSSVSGRGVNTRQVERVSEYIMQLLRGEGPPSGVQTSIPRPITPQAYISLLPTIWSLINGRTSEMADASASLFSVVVQHAIKASSTSTVKRHVVEFLGRLVLLDREPEYIGAFRCGRNPEQDAKLEEWVLQLPQTLWELGGSHLPTTEIIVRLLLRLSQRRSGLLKPATYTALRSRLVPYFTITHPTRGKVRGPYSKLPLESPLRRLILNLAATILVHGRSNVQEDDNLLAAVTDALHGASEAEYFEGIVSSM